MILKAKFLLYTFGLRVSVIIAAPDTLQIQILKGMPEHFPRRFRNDASSPVGNTDPITQFALTVFLSQVTVKMQADAADRKETLRFRHTFTFAGDPSAED